MSAAALRDVPELGRCAQPKPRDVEGVAVFIDGVGWVPPSLAFAFLGQARAGE